MSKTPRAGRDTLPPAKKTKLSTPARTPARTPRQNGYSSLLNGTPSQKPALAATMNGAKSAKKDKIVEATAVVARGHTETADVEMEDSGPAVIEISSAEEESDDSSVDEAAEAPAINGNVDEAEDQEEASFGEKLESARGPRVVDVEATFLDGDDRKALTAASSKRTLSTNSATSLGTVLTQALKTNDKDLLDKCLRVSEVDTIYLTVERLPSPLVGNLLQKLAERLYRTPGRASYLILWLQWSLAAHGGYLASQPQLVKQLATLNKVLKERASGLQPLLALKGRLDMLQAQLELRRRNQMKAANDDDDEAVIYVEGDEDVSSADELESEDEDASSVDEMPTTMELDEDEEDKSDDEDDMLDDEAEETDNDTGDDMSEPLSDDGLDDGDDVSESEEEAKPARRSTVGRAGLARRY